MNDKTMEFLQKLADKLGTTVDHVWSILIRQAPVDAGCTLFSYTFGLVAALLTAIWCYKRWKASNQEPYSRDDGWSVAAMVLLVVALSMVFCLTESLSDIWAGFFNPEYWALQHLPR